MNCPAYELAMREITPLQARVLDVLSVEPLSLSQVATAARCYQHQKAGSRNGVPYLRRKHLDTLTTRNVLGWLAVKGLARREPDGRWCRVGVVIPLERREFRRARTHLRILDGLQGRVAA